MYIFYLISIHFIINCTVYHISICLDNVHVKNIVVFQSLKVTLKPCLRSVGGNKMIEKLKDLQNLVDQYTKEMRGWNLREEQLQKKVNVNRMQHQWIF